MMLTQLQLDRGNSLLNQLANKLNGTEVSLHVHYWGGETSFKTNSRHKHSFFEICYIVDGEGIYMEGDKEYRLFKDTILLTRPEIEHQIINKNKLSVLFVAFEPIDLDSTKKELDLFHLLSKVEQIILEVKDEYKSEWMWKELIAQAQHPNVLMQDIIINLSHSLIFSLIQLYLKDHYYTISSPNKNLSLATALVHRAKLYIRDNLSQSLRLTHVADNLHISSRHLSRIFTEEIGITFTQYLRNERIKRATTLLSTTNLPIKLISNQTGFDTIHYFTTVFKNVMGLTPGQYRKQLTSNDE